MAHALLEHDGDCRNIHGHSYRLHVTVSGRPMHEPGHPKDGMVVDFKQLKLLIKEKILQLYDHALVLNDQTSDKVTTTLQEVSQKIILLPFQPTCENLVLDFVHRIQNELPEGVELAKIRLYETATSYVDWEV